MSHVLIVDDRSDARRSIALPLKRDGHTVYEASSVRDALAVLRASPCRLVVAQTRIQREPDGADLVSKIRTEVPQTHVIVAGHGGVPDAVRAMKAGACDYLLDPIDPGELVLVVREHVDRQARSHSHVSPGHVTTHAHAQEIVTADPGMRLVFAKADQVACVDCTVLITGESGTGKEVVTRRIFQQSRRRSGPLVVVNCGAIPETLVESELFGHRRGSFTSATSDKAGLIEEAEGGVLFLDEVGEMPARIQVTLLRFLDSGEMRRVGDTSLRRVDVRTIAVTNRRLEQEVKAGRFRLDLFHRLSVVSVHVPPLRERPADIPVLAEHFLQRSAARYGKPLRAFSNKAMTLLLRWPWPGNVRELQNVIEGVVVLASGEKITTDLLPLRFLEDDARDPSMRDGADPISVTAALERFEGNVTQAAAALGISRTTLWRRLRRLKDCEREAVGFAS